MGMTHSLLPTTARIVSPDTGEVLDSVQVWLDREVAWTSDAEGVLAGDLESCWRILRRSFEETPYFNALAFDALMRDALAESEGAAS